MDETRKPHRPAQESVAPATGGAGEPTSGDFQDVTDGIVAIVREHFPTVQAIYLFGSFGTEDEWPTSDVDLAVLLPHGESLRMPSLAGNSCHEALVAALGKEVDLLNAREVSTVFQKEIVATGRLLFHTDEAAAEFEMYSLSLYQRLNEERAAILKAFAESGRAYAV
ncbi:MAG: nucleotidyltransferase domain-containing protein [Fimbriimonadaceae bacterium]|nr:nucleotidyltransferase domain-containing protein [Fimbriimonadaceae bacterium]